MLTIKIKTDNQAFDDYKEEEIIRCLNDVIEQISYGSNNGNIHDTNGNNVGTFKLTK